jgi:hypothetical protein
MTVPAAARFLLGDFVFAIQNSRMLIHTNSCRSFFVILFALAAYGCGESSEPAPAPKVVFENGLFRISDVNVPAGTTLEYSYPNPVAMIAMRDGARVRTQASGADWSEEIAPMAGAVSVGEAGDHGVRNIGEAAFQLFALENLRKAGQSSSQSQADLRMTVVAESSSFRAFDVQLNNKNTQVSHVHTVPTVTVLISGKVLSQGPESKDAEIGTAPTGLKQLTERGEWLLAPPGGTHYVVRLGSDPAHVIELELR